MGMFDWVEGELKCPVCKVLNKTWQTKDLLNVLDTYKVGEKMIMEVAPNLTAHPTDGFFNIHTMCEGDCDIWIEAIAYVENGILQRLELESYHKLGK